MEICDWIAFPTVIFRPDKKVIAANACFRQKFGITKEEISQRKCYQVFFSTDEPCNESDCIMGALLAGREGACRVKKTINPDGSAHYEEFRCLPILSDDGVVKLIVATVVDVTPSRMIEADLWKTKELLERIIRNLVKAVVAADMKGQILFMNESAKRLFGYSEKELEGELRITHVIPLDLARDIMQKLRGPDFGGVGKLDSLQMEVKTSSGEKVPIEMSGSIIYDEDGKEVASIAILQDLRPKIEADKKWERARLQLMQSEKLASLGRLAAGVAHEINNPLSGIIMYSHLVLEDMAKDSLACENLMKAVTQAERCKNIVKGLLDFSRHRETEFEIINVNDVIEEVLLLIEIQALFQNIEIVRNLGVDLPTIKGDRSQLQQVFMNLAINAAEAMKGEGKLTIESAFKGEIVIRFSDTGSGIAPENRDKIFEPFFTTRSDKGGSGLGLAISHGIIAGHGGTISFTSKVNEGTTFTVRLPVIKT